MGDKNKFVMKGSQIKNKEYWKQRIKSEVNRRNLKKEIFGDHYNLSYVRINNGKKYFNEEVKIMEIQRSNRLLLQKIKKIAQRSKPRNIIDRARTQAVEGEMGLQRSSTQQRISKPKDQAIRRYRYQSVQSMLQKSRKKFDQHLQRRNQTQHKKQNEQTLNQNKQKQLLYKGSKSISNVRYSFRIYIQKGQYTIIAKTNISQQKIQIPEENYRTLLKEELKNNDKNIFRHLKVGENNKLVFDFRNSQKVEVDVVEKTEFELPLIKNKLSQRIVQGY